MTTLEINGCYGWQSLFIISVTFVIGMCFDNIVDYLIIWLTFKLGLELFPMAHLARSFGGQRIKFHDPPSVFNFE